MKLSAAEARQLGIAVPKGKPRKRKVAEPPPCPVFGDEPVLVIDMPYPPTVNTYWRRGKGRTYISDEGMAYRHAVVEGLYRFRLEPLAGPLKVEALVSPPDNRTRDIDNLGKALWDSLQYARVYESDNQLVDVRYIRGEIRQGGGVIVRLWAALEE